MKLVFALVILVSLTSSKSQSVSPNILETISKLSNNTQLENTISVSNLLSFYGKYNEASQLLKESLDIDSACFRQIRSVVEGIENKELWAVQMLDSSAKFPPGILFGNILSFGNYEECTEIQHFDESLKTDIKGQYCNTAVTLGRSSVDFDIFDDNLLAAAKEFDFTEIGMTFGLCVPSGCTTRDLQNISDALFPGILPIRMTFIEKFCSSKDTEAPLPTRSIIGLFIFSIFGLLLILGTVVDIVDSTDNNSILRCFSVYTNGKKLFYSKTGEDSLLCLNGLRVLSMMLIILGHRLIMTNGMPAVNTIVLESWMATWYNYIFIGLGFAVDTFFTISGLLVVYLFMRINEKGQSIHWGMFYVHRFLRLTPSLIMVVLFYCTMVNLFQYEPFALLDDYLGVTCREYWWTTILYIENYWNPNNMCAVHTWYLAVDTQLYMLSPILLIPLTKYPKATVTSMILIVLFSMCAAFEATWQKNLGATYLHQNPEEYKTLYTPTHIRVAPWMLGAITGYFIAKNRGRPFHINKFLVLLLWIISVGSLLLVLLVQKVYHDNEYDVWYSAIYNTFARSVWGAAVCIVILLCVFGYGGIINTFLSCPLFNVLIRINYAVYLVHMMVTVSILAKIRMPIFLSNFNVIHEALGDYPIILLVAVIWTLAFESPVIALEKIFLPKDKGDKKKLSMDKNDSNGSCETVIVK